MSYLLDGALTAYPSWRNYFDIIVVSAGKPEFFTEERPFVELDAEGLPIVRSADGRPADAPFARGRIYSGGNIRDFQERARASGDRVLFVGDHIYGDMLRSRKSSNWRTAMVLQELEHEVTTYDRMRVPLARLDQLDNQLIHLDSEINERQNAMRTLQKLADRGAARRPPAGGEAADQGRDREAARRPARRDHAAPRRRERDRRRVQPALGPAVSRGLRGQQVRRAGRGLRLRLHQPRLELPLLLADAVLPRPARPHAARTRLASEPRAVCARRIGRSAAAPAPSPACELQQARARRSRRRRRADRHEDLDRPAEDARR